ncbi:response regulator transcription factor [Granulicatella sp. 19428wC4_WM01]|uniref:response regulator transcription factor n=1 Tax=Granulicatella sp. WM01 TaxID=2558277 RepID=UPI0014308CFB|nr:response regulator transcription factor [Granulicatella sp. WM01]MBF0780086.1 response regulator transcription factor [Granulicatella sp. 19428wC4_WM01]
MEDEKAIAEGIQLILNNTGYTTWHAETLRMANQILQTQHVDLLLLDISLPDGNGITFAKNLNHPPKIVFISAIDDEQTIVDTFQFGSDDYITKPFRLPILLARVQAIIKRHRLGEQPSLTHLAHLKIDEVNQQVFNGNKEILFTPTEHRLFFYLYHNIGQILTREQLLAYLWDNHGEFVNDNTLTVTLRRVRHKIEQDTVLIETKRGIGYRLLPNEVKI